MIDSPIYDEIQRKEDVPHVGQWQNWLFFFDVGIPPGKDEPIILAPLNRPPGGSLHQANKHLLRYPLRTPADFWPPKAKTLRGGRAQIKESKHVKVAIILNPKKIDGYKRIDKLDKEPTQWISI